MVFAKQRVPHFSLFQNSAWRNAAFDLPASPRAAVDRVCKPILSRPAPAPAAPPAPAAAEPGAADAAAASPEPMESEASPGPEASSEAPMETN